jgi:hypothetical protein
MIAHNTPLRSLFPWKRLRSEYAVISNTCLGEHVLCNVMLLPYKIPVSNLDTQIHCLAEVLSMVAGSDFEMLEVQLTANVIVEH